MRETKTLTLLVLTMETLEGQISPGEISSLASYLSSYHRVQGSPGIVEVAEAISDYLNDNGIDSVILKYQHDKSLYPFESDLLGWSIKSANLKLISPHRLQISSFPFIPTSVVAHSPPGSFSGEVLHIPRLKEAIREAEGKVVLSPHFSFESYINAVKSGAIAAIFYRRTGSSTAFPYYSLFPSQDDIPYLKIPAFTVPRELAQIIEGWIERGKKVVLEGYIEATYTGTASIPVVEAIFGSGEEEYHITAHMCHPGMTVNDNISGVVGSVAGAVSIKRSNLEEKLIDKKIVFLWIPEFSGTIAYLRTAVGKRKIRGAINLDMIGEIENISGSSLNFVRPPVHMLSDLEAKLLREILRALPRERTFSSPIEYPARKLWIVNYESGSDHDVYVSLGIPAMMLNFWPDRFYHSSEDTMDKFDPKTAMSIGIAAVRSIISQLSEREVRGYYNMVYGIDLLKAEPEAASYVESLYCDVGRERGIYFEGCGKIESTLIEEEKTIKLRDKGYPSFRAYRHRLDRELYEKLLEIQEEHPWIRTVNVLIPSILGWKEVGEESLRRIVTGETGHTIPNEAMRILTEAQRQMGILSWP